MKSHLPQDYLLFGLTADERNPYVEPITNASQIGCYNIIRPWPEQCEEFLDASFMRYFLHESAHHCSLIGPVGGALAQLSYSAYGLVQTPSGDDLKYNISARDAVVYRTAWQLFEPLLEGIALFQEHDSLPGNSPCTTNSMLCLAASLLTAMHNKKPGQRFDAFQALGDLLRVARINYWEWKEGKATLLSIGPYDRPHYLLGYLAVKTTYRRLKQKSKELFEDPDLFVALMNDYWFGDFRMERILLGDIETKEMSEQATWTPFILTEYFQDRWQQLFDNVSEYVNQYIAFTSGQTQVEPSYRNQQYMPDQMNRLIRISGRALKASGPKVFLHRTHLRYSVEEGTIRCDGTSREATVSTRWGDRIVPTFALMRAGVYRATIEGVFTIRYKPVVLVTDGITPVAVLDPMTMEWNREEMVTQFQDYPALTYVMQLATDAQVFSTVEKGSPLDEHVVHSADQIAQMIRSFYGQLAFVVDESKAKAVLAAIDIKSFRDVLRNFFSEAINWSQLSGTRGWDAKRYAEVRGETLEILLDRIGKANSLCSAAYGWEPFFILDGKYVGSRI